MKKWMTLSLALLLGLSLMLPVVAEPAPLPQREETIVLEGMEETYIATQYVLPGRFGLWYPAADFEPTATEKGARLTLKNNFLNADVYLDVALVAEAGQPAPTALEDQMVVHQEEGWTTNLLDAVAVQVAGQATPGYIAMKGAQSMQVFLVTLPSGSYLVTLTYPMEAAEGWGARMMNILLGMENAA